MPTHFIHYIQNEAHYKEMLMRYAKVKKELWIGTADIIDVYIVRYQSEPFLKLLNELPSRRVAVRLEPQVNFRKDFDKYPLLRHDLKEDSMFL